MFKEQNPPLSDDFLESVIKEINNQFGRTKNEELS